MEKWLGYRFRSSIYKTDEFKSFARDFKKELSRQIVSTGLKIVDFNVGHFFISGFVQNIDTYEFAYFSISDVRYSQDSWYEHVLVRTAKHEKDFTGGANMYTTFPELANKLAKITERKVL